MLISFHPLWRALNKFSYRNLRLHIIIETSRNHLELTLSPLCPKSTNLPNTSAIGVQAGDYVCSSTVELKA